MGLFAGLKDAKRGFQTNKLKEGRYVVRIDECQVVTGDQAGTMWKNTLTILGVIDGTHRVGEVVNTCFWQNSGKQQWFQNIKGFLAGVLDVADDQIDDKNAEIASGETQPMRGLVTIVAAHQRTSQKRKDDKTGEAVQYSVYSWSPSLDSAQIAEAIGAGGVKRFFPNGL